LYKELKGLVLREKLVSNFSVSTFCSKLLVWHKPIIIIMIMSKFSRGYTRSFWLFFIQELYISFRHQTMQWLVDFSAYEDCQLQHRKIMNKQHIISWIKVDWLSGLTSKSTCSNLFW
jgi:hypothetical protein